MTYFTGCDFPKRTIALSGDLIERVITNDRFCPDYFHKFIFSGLKPADTFYSQQKIVAQIIRIFDSREATDEVLKKLFEIFTESPQLSIVGAPKVTTRFLSFLTVKNLTNLTLDGIQEGGEEELTQFITTHQKFLQKLIIPQFHPDIFKSSNDFKYLRELSVKNLSDEDLSSFPEAFLKVENLTVNKSTLGKEIKVLAADVQRLAFNLVIFNDEAALDFTGFLSLKSLNFSACDVRLNSDRYEEPLIPAQVQAPGDIRISFGAVEILNANFTGIGNSTTFGVSGNIDKRAMSLITDFSWGQNKKTNVKNFFLKDFRVDKDVVESFFENFSSVENLALEFCHNFNNDAFKAIVNKLPNIRRLGIISPPQVGFGNEVMDTLASLEDLEDVKLLSTNFHFDEESLKRWIAYRKEELEAITMPECPADRVLIKDCELPYLQTLVVKNLSLASNLIHLSKIAPVLQTIITYIDPDDHEIYKDGAVSKEFFYELKCSERFLEQLTIVMDYSSDLASSSAGLTSDFLVKKGEKYEINLDLVPKLRTLTIQGGFVSIPYQHDGINGMHTGYRVEPLTLDMFDNYYGEYYSKIELIE